MKRQSFPKITRESFLLAVTSVVILLISSPSHASSQHCKDLFDSRGTERSSKPLSKSWHSILNPRYKDRGTTYSSKAFHHQAILIPRSMGLAQVKLVSQKTVMNRTWYLYDFDDIKIEISRPLRSEHRAAPRYSRQMSDAQARARLKGVAERQKSGGVHTEYDGRYDSEIRSILETLNFVLEQYKDRKDWPIEFLRSLVEIAFQYSDHSIYITVRAKSIEDGSMGPIIATGRMIQAPYASLKAIRAARGDYTTPDDVLAAMVFGHEHLGHSHVAKPNLKGNPLEDYRSWIIQNGWNVDLWKEMFAALQMEVDPQKLRAPAWRRSGDLIYVPTPAEIVLGKDYTAERTNPGAEVQYFSEPGNFAVLPDRDLPEELRGIGAPAIYFHAARLSRKQSGADGNTAVVGTYASEGGGSNRYYKYLGYEVHDVLRPNSDSGQQINNPTSDTWNFLMASQDIFQDILRKRLGFTGTKADLERHFRLFDEFEKSEVQSNR